MQKMTAPLLPAALLTYVTRALVLEDPSPHTLLAAVPPALVWGQRIPPPSLRTLCTGSWLCGSPPPALLACDSLALVRADTAAPSLPACAPPAPVLAEARAPALLRRAPALLALAPDALGRADARPPHTPCTRSSDAMWAQLQPPALLAFSPPALALADAHPPALGVFAPVALVRADARPPNPPCIGSCAGFLLSLTLGLKGTDWARSWQRPAFGSRRRMLAPLRTAHLLCDCQVSPLPQPPIMPVRVRIPWPA